MEKALRSSNQQAAPAQSGWWTLLAAVEVVEVVVQAVVGKSCEQFRLIRMQKCLAR